MAGPSQDSRELLSPPFEPPPYTISFAEDGTLQWDPPIGSPDLALALSYHFPLQKTLEEKMQVATGKWLKQQRKARPSSGAREVEPQVREPKRTTKEVKWVSNFSETKARELKPAVTRPASSNLPLVPSLTAHKRATQHAKNSTKSSSFESTMRTEVPGTTSWRLQGGQFALGRRTKRAYTDKERKEVGRNRGMVCEFHRAKKLKCDPNTCPHNKLRAERQAAQKEAMEPKLSDPGQAFFTDSKNESHFSSNIFMPFLTENLGNQEPFERHNEDSSPATNLSGDHSSQSPQSRYQETRTANFQSENSSLSPNPHAEQSSQDGHSPETVGSSNTLPTVDSTLSEPHDFWSPTGLSPVFAKREMSQFDTSASGQPSQDREDLQMGMGVSEVVNNVDIPLFGDQWADYNPLTDFDMLLSTGVLDGAESLDWNNATEFDMAAFEPLQANNTNAIWSDSVSNMSSLQMSMPTPHMPQQYARFGSTDIGHTIEEKAPSRFPIPPPPPPPPPMAKVPSPARFASMASAPLLPPMPPGRSRSVAAQRYTPQSAAQQFTPQSVSAMRYTPQSVEFDALPYQLDKSTREEKLHKISVLRERRESRKHALQVQGAVPESSPASTIESMLAKQTKDHSHQYPSEAGTTNQQPGVQDTKDTDGLISMLRKRSPILPAGSFFTDATKAEAATSQSLQGMPRLTGMPGRTIHNTHGEQTKAKEKETSSTVNPPRVGASYPGPQLREDRSQAMDVSRQSAHTPSRRLLGSLKSSFGRKSSNTKSGDHVESPTVTPSSNPISNTPLEIISGLHSFNASMAQERDQHQVSGRNYDQQNGQQELQQPHSNLSASSSSSASLSMDKKSKKVRKSLMGYRLAPTSQGSPDLGRPPGGSFDLQGSPSNTSSSAPEDVLPNLPFIGYTFKRLVSEQSSDSLTVPAPKPIVPMTSMGGMAEIPQKPRPSFDRISMKDASAFSPTLSMPPPKQSESQGSRGGMKSFRQRVSMSMNRETEKSSASSSAPVHPPSSTPKLRSPNKVYKAYGEVVPGYGTSVRPSPATQLPQTSSNVEPKPALTTQLSESESVEELIDLDLALDLGLDAEASQTAADEEIDLSHHESKRSTDNYSSINSEPNRGSPLDNRDGGSEEDEEEGENEIEYTFMRDIIEKPKRARGKAKKAFIDVDNLVEYSDGECPTEDRDEDDEESKAECDAEEDEEMSERVDVNIKKEKKEEAEPAIKTEPTLQNEKPWKDSAPSLDIGGMLENFGHLGLEEADTASDGLIVEVKQERRT